MAEVTRLRNLPWMTTAAVADRIGSAFQTVLIARTVGIVEYGIYGLVFATAGLVSSVAAVQMGLTSTILIAKYRECSKEKTSYVINFVRNFAWSMSALVVLVTILCHKPLTIYLLKSQSPDYENVILLGSAIVVTSIVSGVQEGIMAGFEDFRRLAMLRLLTTIVSLALVVPMGRRYGLVGVMAGVFAAPLLKVGIMARVVRAHIRRDDLPQKGAGLRPSELLWGLSVPSMLASLTSGLAAWLGTFMLSGQIDGFKSLAFVSTGLQWRMPIFLFTSTLSSVALPVLTRQIGSANSNKVAKLNRELLWYGGALSAASIVLIVGFAPVLLGLYGQGFNDGQSRFIFALVVASAFPQVVTNVYLQDLCAHGELWTQLRYYIISLLLPMVLAFYVAIPKYSGLGYAMANLTSWIVFMIFLMVNRHSAIKITSRSIS